MIKRLIACTILTLTLSAFVAEAQMSDSAIMAYVAQGMAAGKTKTQIGNELLAKGVTVAQAKRIMKEYKQGQSDEFSGTINQLDTVSRKKSGRDVRGEMEYTDEYGRTKEKTARTLNSEKMDARDLEREEEKVTVLKDGEKKIVIFGHKLFKSANLSFEPNENVATPSTYVLGPGDEVVIDVWGVNEASLSQTISPEGKIFISKVGLITLSGLTIDQATNKIKKSLSSIFSLGGPDPASHLSVTLGKLRTIQVNVLGEVKYPGTYRLSSLSSALNAIYRAGGVTDIGTLREITILHNGQTVDVLDFYQFIFNGKSPNSIILKDGDAVIVPTFSALAEAGNGFKRPMYYEVKDSDTVGDFIKFAGGFVSNASTDAVVIQRRNAESGSVHTIKKADFGKFCMKDGDMVDAYLNEQQNLFTNKITIRGAVLRPGIYELGNDIVSVKQLVLKAGGLLDDAFGLRAQIIRERSDRSLEIVALAIGAIMDGHVEDIMLRKNDIVVISSKSDIDKKGSLSINGYVREPGDYEFAEGMTVEDLILLAGGLEDGASTARIDISRRIDETDRLSPTDTLAEVFSFSISDSLKLSDIPAFILKPYDIVAVRKSPSYIEQRRVRISGEVAFPGEYTLVAHDERISQLFERAGGATPNAYIAGAVLKRKVSEDERNTRRNLVTMMKRGGNKKDSTMVDKLVINETYPVGISLNDALENPGSQADVILHDGDELVIPSMTNTVRIQGEVMYPNAVNYIPGENVSYYIQQSGGYSNDAKRTKVYVVYMNGKVSVGTGAKIKPGCEIVVPSKDKEKKISTSEWLAIGTTAASVTTMIATIVSLFKK